MRLQVWCGIGLVSAVGMGLQLAPAVANSSLNRSPSTLTSLDSGISTGISFSEPFQVAQLPDPSRTRTPDPNRDRLIQPGPPPTP